MSDHLLGKEMLPKVIRPLLPPAQCAHAHLTAEQLVMKDAVWDSIKRLNKMQKSHIRCLPFTHWVSDLIIEASQASDTQLSFVNPC